MDKPANKKRFTFADAKNEIKSLKEEVKKLNVDLSDNVVTQEELKVLKIYKGISFVLAAVLVVAGVIAIL